MDYKLAEMILDRFQAISDTLPTSIPVHFEELTAEPGPLPRLMVKASEQAGEVSRYISGETISPFPCTLTLRTHAIDEQGSLSAHEILSYIREEFLKEASSFEGYVAFRVPLASTPACLGRTNVFEDWQVTFDLNYKQTI